MKPCLTVHIMQKFNTYQLAYLHHCINRMLTDQDDVTVPSSCTLSWSPHQSNSSQHRVSCNSLFFDSIWVFSLRLSETSCSRPSCPTWIPYSSHARIPRVVHFADIYIGKKYKSYQLHVHAVPICMYMHHNWDFILIFAQNQGYIVKLYISLLLFPSLPLLRYCPPLIGFYIILVQFNGLRTVIYALLQFA